MSNQEVTAQVTNTVMSGATVIQMENDTQRSIAILQKRDEEKVRDAALKELELYPQFAEKAYYVIPYKDGDKIVNVEGPSIKAAMALGRRWGNAVNGARIVGEDANRIQMEGVFLDYETNFRTVRPISVSKNSWSKKFGKVIPLRDDRLNMAIQAGASKAVRNAILSALPVGLVEEYTAMAKKVASGGTVKKGQAPKPVAERMKDMYTRFAAIGADKKAVDAYLAEHHELESDELVLAHMIGIYNALSDGQAKLEEVFETVEKAAPVEPEKMPLKNAIAISYEQRNRIVTLLKNNKKTIDELNDYLDNQYGFRGTENIPATEYDAVVEWIQGNMEMKL